MVVVVLAVFGNLACWDDDLEIQSHQIVYPEHITCASKDYNYQENSSGIIFGMKPTVDLVNHCMVTVHIY